MSVPNVVVSVPLLVAMLTIVGVGAGFAGRASVPEPVAPPPPPQPICKCEWGKPPPPPPPPEPTRRAGRVCLGMTWSLKAQEKNVVRVGSDPEHTNAYAGDTACDQELSVLCLRPKQLPKPEGVASDFYNGWSGAEIGATKPVSGQRLTSRAAADALCTEALGAGWRMVEHHDGGGGWGLSGIGEVPRNVRFWVAINDQSANPWN